MLDVIYNEDCLEGMKRIPDGSVQCCVTSPPYYGLRDYQTGRWEGGGSACDHVLGMARQDTSRETPGGRGGSFRGGTVQYRDVCGKCGAIRIDQQLGLESSPQAYVAKLVRLFREVRRALRSDGTLWLNLGDSYAGGGGGAHKADGANPGLSKSGQRNGSRNDGIHGKPRTLVSLKPKDLIGIPWRVAFALQADGWYLRQDIIWAKSNPMPESVRDRCTKAHEYVFLLSKSARYFFDADAISEIALTSGKPLYFSTGQADAIMRKPTGNQRPENYRKPRGNFRNKRSVWTVNPEPYPGAHFAVMPEALIEPCISAGSSVGGVVLDPFMGSGTVARVAYRLNRHYLGFELNPEYCQLAQQRLRHTQRQFQYGTPPELAEAV